MTTDMQRCEHIAHRDGLAEGLAAALSDVDITMTAPGGYAAVAARQVRDGEATHPHSMAATEDVAFVRCPDDRPATDAFRLAEIARLLAAVRLGVVRRGVDQAVAHLSEREVGGEPLVRKQLVTGAIADAMAEVELLRVTALTQHDPEALADVHTRLDELGWQVAMLFGAAGYILDHPARALHVSALVANTWIDREAAPR